MRAIFISYRREDAEGQAGRLFDDLARYFGEDSVFMDVAGIEPGRDFRRVIDEHVASCGVLLAMIGKSWIDAADESGRRRLDDPMDFVRLETASALKRDIPVVPVLVHGARMPRAEQLPEDLAELAYRNGVELTHARWDSDVQVLIKALSPYVESLQKNAGRVDIGSPAATSKTPTASAAPSGVPPVVSTAPIAAHSSKKTLPMIVAGSVAALVIAVGGYAWHQKSAERAEAVRQAALLEETKKKAAAEELEATKRAEEKAAADALEIRKQAAEKAVAEAEAKRRAQEIAAAEENEKLKKTRDKIAAEKREAERRAQEIAEAEKRDAERRAQEIALAEKREAERQAAEKAAAEKREAENRAREKALADERERMKQAREKTLAEERERMKLAQERAAAAQRARWPSYNFPPPNGGLLVYTIMPDGNPACASYDAGGCLWGLSYDQIDFRRLKPLVCGAEHRARWGKTGYEDPKHWCSLARRLRAQMSLR